MHVLWKYVNSIMYELILKYNNHFLDSMKKYHESNIYAIKDTALGILVWYQIGAKASRM